MTRRARRHTAGAALAVAAIFAATTAAPRAPIVFHTHAGGEHTHVHRDRELLAELGLEDLAHARPHAHAHGDDGPPAWRAADTHGGGHYHQRQYLQSAALPQLAVAIVALPLGIASLFTPAAAPRPAPQRPSARAPPAPLLR